MAQALRGRDIRAANPEVRRRRQIAQREPLKKWADLSAREKDEVLKRLAIKLGLVAED